MLTVNTEIGLQGNHNSIGRPRERLVVRRSIRSVHGDGISGFAIDEFVADDGIGVPWHRPDSAKGWACMPERFDELLLESAVEQLVRGDFRDGLHTLAAFVGRVKDAREHRQRGLTGK